MASALYDSYKQSLGDSSCPDLTGGAIRAIFVTVTAGYTFSAAHQDFADLSNTIGDGGTGRTNGETLQSVSVTNGVIDATDTVFASVTGTIEAIVLYLDSGSDATSSLIAYIDGISETPSGAEVTIQWDSGASKIFAF